TYLNSTVTQWPLWMASYNGQDPQTGGPSSVSPWSTWNFWQNNDTSGNANVPGDVDVFNGTSTTLNNWVIMPKPASPSPADTAQVTGSPSLLDWADVTNGAASSYDVYVDGAFKANVATSSWNVSPALANGSHSWYVIAKNNTGNVTGPTWSFTVN